MSQVIGVEEHFVTPAVMEAWRALDPDLQDFAMVSSDDDVCGPLLAEVGPTRIAAMDDAGVDVQVLSIGPPGLQSLDADLAVGLQTETNDQISSLASGSERFEGFATLATPAPQKAAAELERAIGVLGLDGAMLYGRTGELNLDDQRFWPIFEVAAELKAPLYVHPQTPLRAIRDTYYSGFEAPLHRGFSTYGFGWHVESGIQFLRLLLSGVFDRFPDLQIILGHWGEVVLFYIERLDAVAKVATLQKRPSEYVRSNLYVTPGGVFSPRYLRWSIDALGPERVLFAADYPFIDASDGGAKGFLERADLTESQRARIASENWLELRGGIVR